MGADDEVRLVALDELSGLTDARRRLGLGILLDIDEFPSADAAGGVDFFHRGLGGAVDPEAEVGQNPGQIDGGAHPNRIGRIDVISWYQR